MDNTVIARVRALFRRPLMRVLDGLENPWEGVPDAPEGDDVPTAIPADARNETLAAADQDADWAAAIGAAKARAAPRDPWQVAIERAKMGAAGGPRPR
jgi:hypothetical protein